MRKWIWVLIVVVAVIVLFVGYHVIQHIKATSRMKELSQQLEAKIQAWEKKEYRCPPLYGEPIPGNAAEFYREAIEEFELPDSELDWIAYTTLYDSSEPIPPSLVAYCERNKLVMDLVLKGTQTELYKPLSDLREIPDPSMVGRLTKRKHIGRVMALQGRNLSMNNQDSKAIRLYGNILRFSDDYMRGGCLITALISIAASVGGYEEIRRYLLHHNIPEQHLKELLGYLKMLLDTEPSLLDAGDTGVLYDEVALKQKAESSGIIPRELSWGFYGSLSPTNRAGIVDVWEDIVVFSPRIREIYTLPFTQTKTRATLIDQEISSLRNPISRRLLAGDSISSGVSKGAADYCRRYLITRSMRRGFYILTALKLYHLKHQKYPDKLTGLAPEIIPEVPLDPFTDKSFVYKIDKDGTLFLYSIGKNLTDDGGNEKKYKDIVISPAKTQKEK